MTYEVNGIKRAVVVSAGIPRFVWYEDGRLYRGYALPDDASNH